VVALGDPPRRDGPLREALAAAPLLILLGLFALRAVSGPDTGFHLAAVRFVLAGNGWPDRDPFTFTLGDRPYVDTSWGYQVLLALVERAAGAPGMVLWHVALVVATFALVWATARLGPGSAPVTAALLLIGGLAAEPRFEIRPEVLSYFLLALVLFLLQRHAVGRRAPLALLPVLFLLWVNVHALFVVGLGALACFVAGAWLRERRLDRRLAAWALASVAVTPLNPYGVEALRFPLTLATRMERDNVFAEHIGEFASPLHYLLSDQLRFYFWPTIACLVFLVFALAAIRGLIKLRRHESLLLCAVFVPLALVMVRNVPLLVVACLPGTGWGLAVLLPRAVRPAAGRLGRLGRALPSLLALPLSLCVVHDAYYVAARRTERFGLGWNRLALPIGAAEYAEQAGLGDGILNHLNFGGYLMWRLSVPVFIDGRLEVVGEEFFRYYQRTLGSAPALEACVARYGIRWIVFPYALRPDLLAALSRDGRWALAYFDHLAAVFVRTDGPALLADPPVLALDRPQAPLPDVDALPGLGGPPRRTAAARFAAGLVGHETYPVAARSRGAFHFYRAEAARAVSGFAEAIAQSGGAYPEIYEDLGSALYALGRFEQAGRCFAIALDGLPLYRTERRRHLRERLRETERRLGTTDQTSTRRASFASRSHAGPYGQAASAFCATMPQNPAPEAMTGVPLVSKSCGPSVPAPSVATTTKNALPEGVAGCASVATPSRPRSHAALEYARLATWSRSP
jgi:hypothetical protein